VHNGQYRCSVTNPIGTFVSSVFSVRAGEHKIYLFFFSQYATWSYKSNFAVFIALVSSWYIHLVKGAITNYWWKSWQHLVAAASTLFITFPIILIRTLVWLFYVSMVYGTLPINQWLTTPVIDQPFEVIISGANEGDIIDGNPTVLTCDVTLPLYREFMRVLYWKTVDQFGYGREITPDEHK